MSFHRPLRPDKSSHDVGSHAWPGFVDALSVVLVAVLLCFMIVIVSHVSTQKMASQHHMSRVALQKQLNALQIHHKTQQELMTKITTERTELTQQIEELLQEKARLASLNQEAQETLSRITQSNQEQAKEISTLSKKLEEQLRKQLEKLQDARSVFFEQLKKALKNRKEIRVVGDRFIFSSEVLFDRGSAVVNAKGAKALQSVCRVLQDVMTSLPDNLAWVLRVDGHTDQTLVKPNGRYASNLELSTARAVSVVNFLIQQGFPAHRLAAAGFGSFRPLTAGHPSDKDRRIELLLDQGY